MSSVLLQSETIKQSTYFSPVCNFVENFHDADFELYVSAGEVNMQHLFRLSDIGQMPLHKCVERPGWGGGGCGPLGSNNLGARRRQQPALLWHMTHKFGRCANDKHDEDTRIPLFQQDIVPLRNSKKY